MPATDVLYAGSSKDRRKDGEEGDSGSERSHSQKAKALKKKKVSVNYYLGTWQ